MAPLAAWARLARRHRRARLPIQYAQRKTLGKLCAQIARHARRRTDLKRRADAAGRGVRHLRGGAQYLRFAGAYARRQACGKLRARLRMLETATFTRCISAIKVRSCTTAPCISA